VNVRRAGPHFCLLLWLAGIAACDTGPKGAPSGGGAAKVAPTPSSSHFAVDAGAPAVVLDAGGARSASAAVVGKLPQHANVLLISIDSLRADMPWSGYPRDIAPNLAALEKKSVSFTHSYAVSSYTSMSLGGLLAGRYPSELKRDGFFFGTYPKENLFFPELLQAAKVKTVSAHAHGYFKDAGFQQGFDAWELVPNLKWNNTTDENVTGEAHEKLAEKLLAGAIPEGDQTARFFAWFHFLDPHDMYMPHDADGIPPFGKKPRDKYDAEVLYTDQKVGKLLDFVSKAPWRDRTVIIVTADHGEAFGEHNQFVHGFELWENLTRVPLFVYVPGGGAPKHLETEVSAIDLAPTILEMMGVAADPAMVGRSLLPELLSGKEPEARDVILDLPDTSDNERRRALVRGQKKLVAYGQDTAMRAYDLAADPGEDHPITSGDDYAALLKRYKEASANIKEVQPYACQKSCLNRAYLNQGTK
jgi:choline-sulfatase